MAVAPSAVRPIHFPGALSLKGHLRRGFVFTVFPSFFPKTPAFQLRRDHFNDAWRIKNEMNSVLSTLSTPRATKGRGGCRAALRDGAVFNELPETYERLIAQATESTQAAMLDGLKLLEVEFPTVDLDAVPGDAEGGIEMSTSMQLVFEFAQLLTHQQSSGSSSLARVFFPDFREMATAEAVREGISQRVKVDFLTRPSALEDIGLSLQVDMSMKVQDEKQQRRETFIAAYPYFNVNEMLAVQELYVKAAQSRDIPIIVFNGELDRIRSGYYPSFFYPKLGKLGKEFLPKFEASYYLRNFKGRNGGKLFRMYPGPWQVLKAFSSGKYVCVHTQDMMPSLKEVALNILPQA